MMKNYVLLTLSFLLLFSTHGVAQEIPGSLQFEEVKVAIRLLCEEKSFKCEEYKDLYRGKNVFLKKKVVLSHNDIVKAEFKKTEKEGINSLDFIFSEDGKKKLKSITAKNIGEKLGILIDNNLVMTASIQAEISGGKISIFSKNFNEAKVRNILLTFNK